MSSQLHCEWCGCDDRDMVVVLGSRERHYEFVDKPKNDELTDQVTVFCVECKPLFSREWTRVSAGLNADSAWSLAEMLNKNYAEMRERNRA